VTVPLLFTSAGQQAEGPRSLAAGLRYVASRASNVIARERLLPRFCPTFRLVTMLSRSRGFPRRVCASLFPRNTAISRGLALGSRTPHTTRTCFAHATQTITIYSGTKISRAPPAQKANCLIATNTSQRPEIRTQNCCEQHRVNNTTLQRSW